MTTPTTQPTEIPLHDDPDLPPHCGWAADSFPDAPPPGTTASRELARWEVETGARVARTKDSGRTCALSRYAQSGESLTASRIFWMSLHAFDGAAERWSHRRADCATPPDWMLRRAIVQEMGGEPDEPDEMTTMGFWIEASGFYFDARGPRVVITSLRAPARTIAGAALLRAARVALDLPAPQPGDPVPDPPAEQRPRPRRAAPLPVAPAPSATPIVDQLALF